MDKFTISFAPLQGYTDACYRSAHHACAGGVDEYYTPFVRMEKGEPRRRDLRDTDPAANIDVPTIPQVIASDESEFARLCDALQEQGWQRIDLNMGCPFPMQTKAGRGSGLLLHPDRIEAIASEMQRRPDVVFSVKMRLGQESADEGLSIIPILNDMPLVHITIHPRIGRQQYKGNPDLDTFARFLAIASHPVVYNGDITTLEQIADLRKRFPEIKGVMIGRGLLARPWFLNVHAQDSAIQHDILKNMHARIYRHSEENLCGDSQIIAHLRTFWDYAPITPETRKPLKMIHKSTTLAQYNEAVATYFRIKN